MKHTDFIKGESEVKNQAILKSRRQSAANHAKRKEFGWNGAKKTHCPWGHPYTKENTYYWVQPHGGWARSCKGLHERAAAQTLRETDRRARLNLELFALWFVFHGQFKELGVRLEGVKTMGAVECQEDCRVIPLHCMVCTRQMPDGRRGKTCGPICQRSLSNAKRQKRAGEKCRLCGRRFPRAKELRAVPSEHNAIAAKVGG